MGYDHTTIYEITPRVYAAAIAYFAALFGVLYIARRSRRRRLLIGVVFVCLLLAPTALLVRLVGPTMFFRSGFWILALVGIAVMCAVFALGSFMNKQRPIARTADKPRFYRGSID